jgi:hypothetical protein
MCKRCGKVKFVASCAADATYNWALLKSISNKYLVTLERNQTLEVKFDPTNIVTIGAGSKRSGEAGRGDYSLVPAEVIAAYAQHLQEGVAKGYPRNNWKLGQPLSRLHSSLLRHSFQLLSGKLDEPHDRAVLFNIGSIIFTRAAIKDGRLPDSLEDVFDDTQFREFYGRPRVQPDAELNPEPIAVCPSLLDTAMAEAEAQAHAKAVSEIVACSGLPPELLETSHPEGTPDERYREIRTPQPAIVIPHGVTSESTTGGTGLTAPAFAVGDRVRTTKNGWRSQTGMVGTIIFMSPMTADATVRYDTMEDGWGREGSSRPDCEYTPVSSLQHLPSEPAQPTEQEYNG